MEKSYLKHVLVLLDHDEIRGIDFDQMYSRSSTGNPLVPPRGSRSVWTFRRSSMRR